MMVLSNLGLSDKAPDEIIHELEQQQIELKIQNEELKKAHQDLESSRDRYIDLYDYAPLGYFTLTEDALIVEVNLTGATMLGEVRQKLIQSRFRKFVSPGDRDRWDRYLLEILMSEEKKTCELQLRQQNGIEFTARVEGGQVDKSNRSFQVRISLSDVTDRKKADEEIKISETRYRRLFESAQDGILILNRKTGEITDSNPFIETLTGYSKEELIGKPLWNIGFIRDQVASKAAFEELQEKDYIRYEDLPLETKDGKRIEVEFVSNVYPINLFTSVIQCSIRDITDRKKADEEIKISETRYRRLFESAQDGILILNRKTGEITDSNPFIETLTGYSKEELIGKPLWNIGFIRDQVASKAAFEELQEKDYIRYEDLPLETKDGKRIEVEFVSNVYPIDLFTSVIQCSIRDITDRKKADEEIKISETRYRRLFESAQDGILILNRKTGEITDSNLFIETLTGYSKEELIGKPLWNIGFFRDQVASKVAFEELQEKDYIRYEDLPLETKDGKRIEVEFVSNVYPIDLFTSVIQCSIRDITDRKRAEMALNEASQKLRLLTGLTRHDIINQITVLQLFLDLAIDTSDSDLVNKYIARAQEAGKKIENTIGFTREYENFGTVSSGWLRIYNIIESSKTEVSLGQISVHNRIPGDIEVYADPIIRKVFTTLLENAIRHGGNLTKVCISCSEFEGNMIITCIDDGVGISSAEKELIFDHGYGKHTGIGLFLAREILSITGLSIRECGVEGKGSKFEITIPGGKFRRAEL